MLTWGKIYWPIFLIVEGTLLMVGFLPAEIIALLSRVTNHLDNTLSYYARTELHVTSSIQDIHDVAWYASLIPWVIFVVWITGHIWFDLWG